MVQAAHASRVAGVIRTAQNWIGRNEFNPCGADFVPPPAESVIPLLDDLCAAINDETLPPVVQAAVVHAQFETIHPFADGNGRTVESRQAQQRDAELWCQNRRKRSALRRLDAQCVCSRRRWARLRWRSGPYLSYTEVTDVSNW